MLLRRIPPFVLPTPPSLLLRPSNRLPPSQFRSSSSSTPSESSLSPSTSSSSTTVQNGTTDPLPDTTHPPSLSPSPPSQPKVDEIPVPEPSSTPELPPYNVQHFTPFKKSGYSTYSEMDRLELRKQKEGREKAAVNMFINEGKMPGEIAQLLGVKTGTVRSYFLTQSRSDPSSSIYHAISQNWQRASMEPGTYTFQDCKTMEDAYDKFDAYAAEAERERAAGKGKGKGGFGGRK